MSNILFRSDHEVDLVDAYGSDEMICRAARVSTMGAQSLEASESFGLINFLMKNRHGSPFEHGSMTFRIKTPIFVWREFMRHRIGFSYNEQSGRYMELSPEFYIPKSDRPLRQVGKTGHYEFIRGTEEQHAVVAGLQSNVCRAAWDAYQGQLKDGIAKEVARMCLPLSVYSTAYVTCNPRSLMSFLSLRTKREDSMFPSYPMQEIEEVATSMESRFKSYFPMTHEAFNKNGRVSP